MTISLNDKVIKKSGVSLGEVLLMIAIQNNVDFNAAESELKKKGLISTSYNKTTHLPEGLFVTSAGNSIVNKVILDSDKAVGTKEFIERIENLVPQLQSIYPEGKNFSGQYWRGNKPDIKERLQQFFKQYGDSYTDEQIIRATTEYVKGFDGDYKFMRLLKYFIWKKEVKAGTRDQISELANYMENAGQESDLTNNWTTILV